MTLPFHPDIPLLLEGIPHPAMILNTTFRIISMNRLMEAMTGYAMQRVSGVHGELVVRSNTGNARGQLYSHVLQTGEAASVTGDVLNCYRRKIPVQYTVSMIRDENGEKCGLLVIAENITARQHSTETGKGDFNSIELIGYSPKMQKVFDMIPLMAQTDASVLLTGETGTGKDKIAEVVHQQSSRARFPFIKVNCGALPLGLLESELFGHVKGAFTGASRNKPGMFKLADRGTLFLTEVGDMPMPLQVKLLSVLDDRKFVPVGGEESMRVDVRIIAATHWPLREQVRNHTFREDLFYRLNVLHVHLPPLRERESDVRYLLDHFLQKFTTALGKTIVGFTPAAMQSLLNYNFPGNIRELSNIVEYAVNICKKKKINKEQLPTYIFDKQPQENRPSETAPEQLVEIAYTSRNQPDAPSDSTANSGSSWVDIERQMMVDALRKYGGNRTKAAENLGWGRMKLWRKMKNSGLLQ
jgi:PAS domain S-box-containing protein